MTAGKLCVRTVVIVRKTDTIVHAAQTMRNHHVGSVIVVEERGTVRTPVGIVTDRDLVVGVLANAPEHLGSLLIGDVLVDPLVTAREDELVHDVIGRMRAHGVRRLPVVDAHGGLVGVLSFDDLVDFIAEEMSDLATLLQREQRREQQARA